MYEAKDYSHLLGLEGMSDTLLNNHFGLYGGYVKNTNGAMELMKKHLEAGNTYEYGEVKRRYGWEFNGMRLHEYYFGGMTKVVQPLAEGSLKDQIIKDFGSVEAWEKDFRAVLGMRGIGWTITYYDKMGDCLINTWINEHDMGHLAGSIPVIVADVFEHAYAVDYGTAKAPYIDAYMKAIDWQEAQKRFQV